MNEKDADAIVAALTVLAHYGVPTDVQELLLRGNPDLKCRPGALAAALIAANPTTRGPMLAAIATDKEGR